MRGLRGRLTLGVITSSSRWCSSSPAPSSPATSTARSARSSTTACGARPSSRARRRSRRSRRSCPRRPPPRRRPARDPQLAAPARSAARCSSTRASPLDPHRAAAARASTRSPSAATRYRTYAETLRDPGLGGLVRLEVATSLADLEHRRAALRRRLALIGARGAARRGRRASGSRPTSCCARCGGCAQRRPGSRPRATSSARSPSRGPAELRALAGSFNAMLGRLGALGRGPQPRARRHPPLRRRRRARAAHAADERAGDAVGDRAPPGHAAAQRGDSPATRSPSSGGSSSSSTACRRSPAATRPRSSAPTSTSPSVVDASVAAVAARHPGTTLTADAPEEPVAYRGWEPGLRILVANLVENAARHGRRRRPRAGHAAPGGDGAGRRSTSRTTARGSPRPSASACSSRSTGSTETAADRTGLRPRPRARRPAGAPARRRDHRRRLALGGALLRVAFPLRPRRSRSPGHPVLDAVGAGDEHGRHEHRERDVRPAVVWQ